MRVYGLDFTSAPSHRKPVTCAACVLEENILVVRAFSRFTDFPQFEAFLEHEGAWIAGLDFPFGQAAKLVRNMNWGFSWEQYVSSVSKQTMKDFAQQLENYRITRAKGDKQHLRAVDAYANSRSPMMMFGVPVGRMFFQGAPRLLRSPVSILPCRPAEGDRIVVEAYPALVARKWIGREGYKSDSKRKQTLGHHVQRQTIVDGIRTECRQYYGVHLALPDDLASGAIDDPSGDTLDAVLCAIQAAWAYTRRDSGFGIPSDCNPLEGWIVDPDTLAHKTLKQ